MKALFVGLTTIDFQYFVDEFPKSNVKIKSNPPDIIVGGPATNAAIAFSFLNGSANLISAVGENPFKNIVYEDFKNTNIRHFDIAEAKKTNPVLATVITSGTGDRNIFTHNPEKIISEINASKLIEDLKPEIIMTDGFYPEFSIGLIKIAQEKNIPVVLDGGSWKPQHKAMLPFVDYAICSDDFFPPRCNTSKEVLDFLTNSGIKNSAITRGEKPIIFTMGNNAEKLQIAETKAVDTLGAGDFFHGAFTFYILMNRDFKSALQKASKLASTTCTFKGTRKWLKFANRVSFV